MILYPFKRKVFILAQPEHPNLGDQAQLLCTHNWLKKNYPKHMIVELGYFLPTINIPRYSNLPLKLLKAAIILINLKLTVRKADIFIGHSGYFFVDHHYGWNMFLAIIRFFPANKTIIFPQTVNFYTPYIKKIVSNILNKYPNVLLMCRDKISYSNAKELFPNIKLLLFPDIVTSLIGTKSYSKKREGILFCMRDDVEALYSESDINELMDRFEDIRKEKIDTTIKVSSFKMERQRQQIIENMIAKIASFKVVITDRYHGTIFSAIASTPVIVISSSDHKLESGVKWFPKDVFEGYVNYAESLEDAYVLAKDILSKTDLTYSNKPYFKDNYYDKLYGLLNKESNE